MKGATLKLSILIMTTIFSVFAFAHEDWNISGLAVEATLGGPFINHDKAESHLSMNLKFEPFKDVFNKVDHFSYRTLRNSGEAHITVISSNEYQSDLAKFVTMKEINEIALNADIQHTAYKAVCLGRASLSEKEKYLESYFIVVESEGLLNIRKKVAELYKKRGGTQFDPLHFHPHITLGYTERDLNESDGVSKSAESCMKTLHISPKPSSIEKLPIANSYFVDQTPKGGAIIRGSAPLNHYNLELMKKFGISEVVIFKNDKAGEVKSEMGGLTELGLPKNQVTHINFDWKDNQDFTSGCKKIIQGISLLKDAMKNNKKLFFHCTTGEDRTGVLAASYLLAEKRSTNIKTLFLHEMCEKGYEAGDPDKEKEVVAKIREGLTKTFLKTAYRIEKAKSNSLPIDDKICSNDPTNEVGFIDFLSQMDFRCEQKVAK